MTQSSCMYLIYTRRWFNDLLDSQSDGPEKRKKDMGQRTHVETLVAPWKRRDPLSIHVPSIHETRVTKRFYYSSPRISMVYLSRERRKDERKKRKRKERCLSVNGSQVFRRHLFGAFSKARQDSNLRKSFEIRTWARSRIWKNYTIDKEI